MCILKEFHRLINFCKPLRFPQKNRNVSMIIEDVDIAYQRAQQMDKGIKLYIMQSICQSVNMQSIKIELSK